MTWSRLFASGRFAFWAIVFLMLATSLLLLRSRTRAQDLGAGAWDRLRNSGAVAARPTPRESLIDFLALQPWEVVRNDDGDLSGTILWFKRDGSYSNFWVNQIPIPERDSADRIVKHRWRLQQLGENDGRIIGDDEEFDVHRDGADLVIPGEKPYVPGRLAFSDSYARVFLDTGKAAPPPRQLVAHEWVRASEFGDPWEMETITFSAEGNFQATYRHGSCQRAGRWGVRSKAGVHLTTTRKKCSVEDLVGPPRDAMPLWLVGGTLEQLEHDRRGEMVLTFVDPATLGEHHWTRFQFEQDLSVRVSYEGALREGKSKEVEFEIVYGGQGTPIEIDEILVRQEAAQDQQRGKPFRDVLLHRTKLAEPLRRGSIGFHFSLRVPARGEVTLVRWEITGREGRNAVHREETLVVSP